MPKCRALAIWMRCLDIGEIVHGQRWKVQGVIECCVEMTSCGLQFPEKTVDNGSTLDARNYRHI